jgi:hypothetical protein
MYIRPDFGSQSFLLQEEGWTTTIYCWLRGDLCFVAQGNTFLLPGIVEAST